MTKIKRHACEETVREGQVREQDRVGNDRADEAADFGPRRVEPEVIDAQRNLSGLQALISCFSGAASFAVPRTLGMICWCLA